MTERRVAWPAPLSVAGLTEIPHLAARLFARAAGPAASTSLRVDVPTLVLWEMQAPVCLSRGLNGIGDAVRPIDRSGAAHKLRQLFGRGKRDRTVSAAHVLGRNCARQAVARMDET